ncbi:MAG: hypothetical protein PHU23_19725 [Dehalococcoidales bacterium]|nr:hypothetical protein [Dehalococcoidales bacterium]
MTNRNGPPPPNSGQSLQGPDEYTPKGSVKPQGQSMFDSRRKKPTQQEFQQQVQQTQETQSGYKKRAAELFVQFQRAMADKTLPQNRNVFNAESDKELLQNMIILAAEINSDPNERESEGSLTWIVLLLKTCFTQRDRLNELEYNISVLNKKLDPTAMSDFINKEISKALDKKKGSE